MAHELPALPYAHDALEPFIDTMTMQIHHGKHHATYVTNLNAALEQYPDLQKHSVDDLVRNIANVPEAIRTAVRNNGGGHANHAMFWQIMAPKAGGEPSGPLADAIKASFGSFEAFKGEFKKAALGRFGSGWAWLVNTGGKLDDREHAEPGQPGDGRQAGGDGHRRVGARLLPEVPEPPRRLRGRVVERGQLERDREAVRAVDASLSDRSKKPVVSSQKGLKSCAQRSSAPFVTTRLTWLYF